MFNNNSRMNTIFRKNGTSINSIITQVNGKNQAMIDMYKQLSILVASIKKLYDMFSAGQFFEVASFLTQPVYESLSRDFNLLEVDPVQYPEYETIRRSELLSLQGMYKGIQQYALLVNTENALTSAQECCATLRDPKKLSDYLKMMQNNRRIFPDSSVQIAKATLKPQYAEYIRMYGYPPGGIFDMIKMADILIALNISTSTIQPNI
jgi:hypothetical protein